VLKADESSTTLSHRNTAGHMMRRLRSVYKTRQHLLSKLTNALMLSLSFYILLMHKSLFALTSNESTVEQRLTIYTEHFPPYNFISENSVTGINAELVRAICKDANIACEFKLHPWNRAFRMAEETPNSGLISTAKTQAREPRFKWVGPLASGTQCIYKLSSRTDIQVEDASSLTQYTLAAIRDNSHSRMLEALGFKASNNLVWFTMKYGELRPFASGRVDFSIGSALTIESQINHASLTLSDIAPVFAIDQPLHDGNYLALNINTNDTIVNSLQESLERLLINKEFETIENKFVKPTPMTQTNAKNETLWNTCVKTTKVD